jgi:Fuc2NAc and GlcNAc transferase
VLTVLLTYLLIKIGIRKGVIDIPNERSSHTSPVPRGGGLAVVISFSIFLLIYPGIVDGAIENSLWKSLLLGGAIIAAIGFVDDLGHIAAVWRFLTHVVAAVLSLSLLPSLPDIQLFGFNLDLGVFGYLFFVVSLVWFVNLFNFMDGIDGVASVEAITILGSAALILYVQGQVTWLTLLSYLAVCIAGFLVWNWPPAKVFMGDACSGFLGFTLGLLMIATSVEGAINLWAWAILCGVFLVDATTTVIRRMVRREKWYEAHRSHAYQILSRRFRSHAKVSLGVMIVNVVWLLPLGLLAAVYPYWGFALCCVALLPLLALALRVGAGKQGILE